MYVLFVIDDQKERKSNSVEWRVSYFSLILLEGNVQREVREVFTPPAQL
jgi:hypothetical protein